MHVVDEDSKNEYVPKSKHLEGCGFSGPERLFHEVLKTEGLETFFGGKKKD
jgi:hypothetical protein